MTTIVVKQDGTGTYDNLTDAFGAANRYDIIEIQDSETYNEGNLYKVRADLTIRAGTDPSGARYTPILDGGGTLDCAIKFYNDWIIDGLTITNYDGTATYGAGLISVAGNRTVTIRNCTLYNLADSAITGLKDGSVVENCKIYDIHTLISARGIDSGVESATITNCLIYDVIHDGIQSTDTASLIQHCTLYNVGYAGGTGGYGISGGNGTVKYCVVSDPQHILTAAGIKAVTHSYNCVSGSEGSVHGNYYGGAGTGDIVTDPLLVSGSFKLSEASPCRLAAVGSTTTRDILSGSRNWEFSHAVNGVNSAPTYDMGALEFVYTTVDGVDTELIAKVMGVTD